MARLTTGIFILEMVTLTYAGGAVCVGSPPTLILSSSSTAVTDCISDGITLLFMDLDSDEVTFTIDSVSPQDSAIVKEGNDKIKCSGADFTPKARTYTVTISFTDNICDAHLTTTNYIITFDDFTEPPQVYSANIFKDIFLTGTANEKSLALNTTEMGIDTGAETVTIASTSPGSVPLEISGFSLTVTGSLLSFSSQINVTLTVDNAGTTRDIILVIDLIERPYFDAPEPYTAYEFCEDFMAGDIVADDISFVNPTGASTSTSVADPDPSIFDVNKVNDTHAQIVLNSGLSSASAIDVESESSVLAYNITIRISDGTNSHDLPIRFTVGDVNDNEPVIVADSEVHVLESITAGSNILNVTVTDNDRDAPNNEVTLTIDGEDNSDHFELSGTSVLIKTPSALNFTLVSAYNLTLKAVDNADPVGDRLTSSTTVSVIVDTAPAFQKPAVGESPVEINEATAAGENIFTLEATDQDNAPNSLSYSIVSVSPNTPNLFEIDGSVLKTAAAMTSGALDVDAPNAATQYELTVRVSDGSYSDDRTLTVQVTDVNDNGPVFSETVSTVTVPENANSGFITVVATDGDLASPNNEVTYSVADENFAIGASSGEVTVVKELTQPEYLLSVRATDGGSPARTAFATVEITVNGDAVDECASIPCKNGATCQSGINSYNCTCATGWSGTQCEINIDDCVPMPCDNGGTCSDLVADYSCDCEPGWEGVNCSTACTGNKFGRNCNQTCSCNGANVASNAGAQHCNIQNGTCFCDAKWTGASCNQDVNECLQTPSICTEAKTICNNTNGGHECICIVGYTRASSNAQCAADTTESNPNILQVSVVQQAVSAGALTVNVTVRMNFQTDQCEALLQNPDSFTRIKGGLEGQLKARLNATTLNIYNIRCGSLIYDVFLSAPNASEDAVQLSADLERLKEIETLTVENQSVSVTKMTVNNIQIPEANSLCTIYEALTPCGNDYMCQVKDNKPYCHEIKDDNSDIILGVGIGVGGLGVLMLIALGVALFVTQKRRRNSGKIKSNSKSRKRSRNHSSHTDRVSTQKSSHLMPSAYNMHSYMDPPSDTTFYYGPSESRRKF